MGVARRDEAGTISGAMDMMEAVCRVAAPLAGGVLLEHMALDAPPLVGCVLALAGAATLYEVAPAEHRSALLKHGLGHPPEKKKAA
jgi:predicted MFS family arabinose efflux permease